MFCVLGRSSLRGQAAVAGPAGWFLKRSKSHGLIHHCAKLANVSVDRVPSVVGILHVGTERQNRGFSKV